MGQRGSIPLTATPQYIMRWHHLVVLLLLLVVLAEAKKKPSKGKKPGKKPSKPSKPKCPADTINKAKFMKYTVTTGKGKNAKPVADQPCWFDLKRNDCAKCKPGGVQCGAPMEKWCQSKKSKTGCPGIPQFKYTRSSTGFPCYWDPKSLECAWCVTNMVQCKDGSTSDPKKCGRHCKPAKDQKCDGVKTTCENIPKCGLMASCQKVGNSANKKCQCKKGFSGNGFQCKDDKTGDWATNPAGEVEMTIETDSKFWVYPQGSNLFPQL